jgi:hypothetical protein
LDAALVIPYGIGPPQVLNNSYITVPLSLHHPLQKTKLTKRKAAQAVHYQYIGRLTTPDNPTATCTESAEEPI